MNNTDLQNMKALLKYKEVVAKGPKFESEDNTITQEELEKYSIDELKDSIYKFEHSEEDKYTKELKDFVNEMFVKYGEEGDNMIAVWDANVFERHISEGEPLSDINWEGFEYRYNKLYYPICRNWDCSRYCNRKDKDEETLKYWDSKWDEYFDDIKKLKKILLKLKIKDAYDYWKNDNDALNELWYGVIGVMKDYRVVSFVIRDDGMLCDEDEYETFYNKIVKKF